MTGMHYKMCQLVKLKRRYNFRVIEVSVRLLRDKTIYNKISVRDKH